MLSFIDKLKYRVLLLSSSPLTGNKCYVTFYPQGCGHISAKSTLDLTCELSKIYRMGKEPLFLVDVMLGKLARWLRVLGWDAKYAGNSFLERLSEEARDESRIFLTRKQDNEHEQFVFITSEKLEEQLIQLERALKILTLAEPFTRCIECNAGLEDVSKVDVKGKVPFYVYQTVEKFSRCPSCGKVFWQGSHYEVMLERITRLKQVP